MQELQQTGTLESQHKRKANKRTAKALRRRKKTQKQEGVKVSFE